MAGPLAVRDAVPEDADALAAIGTDSFLEAYGGTADPEAIAEHVADVFGRDGILAEMSRPGIRYQLACLGSIPTGLLKLRDDESELPRELAGRKVLELQQVYVHSDYQGYGVGRALVDSAVHHGRRSRFEGLWLQAWGEADWAIAFYRRNGFQKLGHIPYHLGDRVYDDWVLYRAF